MVKFKSIEAPAGASDAYIEGYNNESLRRAMKLGAMDFSALAAAVADQLRRDDGRKQRILARSPHLARSMDAANMSSRELVMRELKELGITPGNNDDPEMMLDMHHAGRQFRRAQGSAILDKYLNSEEPGTTEEKSGSASDSADSSRQTILDKYLNS